MHATFAAPRTSALRNHALLVHYDRALLEASGKRGLARAGEQGLGSAEDRAALARAHEAAVDALTTCTLVHGDFYPSNIVVAGERIAVVDWELAGIGAGELDLAALAAGKWDDAHRRDLARAYHREATELGQTEPFAALMRRFTLASVHLALRWLGAAPGWRAPDEHQRNWFADALCVLDQLGDAI
jgi:aminoglycoside phosphotransferase (APT) family kinase protein